MIQIIRIYEKNVPHSSHVYDVSLWNCYICCLVGIVSVTQVPSKHQASDPCFLNGEYWLGPTLFFVCRVPVFIGMALDECERALWSIEFTLSMWKCGWGHSCVKLIPVCLLNGTATHYRTDHVRKNKLLFYHRHYAFASYCAHD